MITMSELEDTDKEIQEALSEYEIDRLSLEMKLRQAVLYYLRENKGKPLGPHRIGYAQVAKQFDITVEQLRGALRKYLKK